MPTSGLKVYKDGSRYLVQCENLMFVTYRNFVVELDSAFLKGQYTQATTPRGPKVELTGLRRVLLTDRQRREVTNAVNRYGLHIAGGLGSSAENVEETRDIALRERVLLTNPNSGVSQRAREKNKERNASS